MKEELKKQLIRDEGVMEHAYQDHLGYWTIGVGRLIDKRKGGRLRQNEIEFLLDNDIADRVAALTEKLPWFSRLDEARQGVLLNMSFQMGVKGLLGFRSTLKMVENGEYTNAANGMLQSLWARQTPDRAKRLSEQMRTGIWK